MTEQEIAGLVDEVESGLATTGDPLVDEARRRFERAAEWEAAWRPLFLQDIKFANGDAANGYQWPNGIRRTRDVSSRPCLTMNIIRQHNLEIQNRGLQAKEEVRIIGTGGGATADSAGAMNQVVGHIQYHSRAQLAYKVAREFQTQGGMGYWRLATDWASPDSFDQEIQILPILDPLSVFIDPDCKQIRILGCRMAVTPSSALCLTMCLGGNSAKPTRILKKGWVG